MVNLEDKWRAEFCVDNNCTDMESRFDPCLVPEWNGYLKGRWKSQAELIEQERLFSINLRMCRDFHEANLTKVQDMHDGLLKLVKRAKPWVSNYEDYLSTTEASELGVTEWLKEVGEII